MDRNYIESLNNVRPFCFETDREEEWYNIGLIDGLEIADQEPIKGYADIEKACEWIKQNVAGWNEAFIEKFRKEVLLPKPSLD